MQLLVQFAGGRFGAGTVVGEAGVDLDRHVPVEPIGLVVDLREHVARAMDVGQHHRPVVVDDGVLVLGESCELLVVVGRALDRLLEDRRVGREAAHTRVTDGGELS